MESFASAFLIYSQVCAFALEKREGGGSVLCILLNNSQDIFNDVGKFKDIHRFQQNLIVLKKLVNKSISFRGLISSRCSYPFGDKAIFYKLDIPRNKFLLELQIYLRKFMEIRVFTQIIFLTCMRNFPSSSRIGKDFQTEYVDSICSLNRPIVVYSAFTWFRKKGGGLAHRSIRGLYQNLPLFCSIFHGS